MTPVLSFDTVCIDAQRRIEQANSLAECHAALAHGSGTLFGYFLAGAVPVVTYHAAKQAMRRCAESRASLLDLRDGLEHAHGAA